MSTIKETKVDMLYQRKDSEDLVRVLRIEKPVYEWYCNTIWYEYLNKEKYPINNGRRFTRETEFILYFQNLTQNNEIESLKQ